MKNRDWKREIGVWRDECMEWRKNCEKYVGKGENISGGRRVRCRKSKNGEMEERR